MTAKYCKLTTNLYRKTIKRAKLEFNYLQTLQIITKASPLSSIHNQDFESDAVQTRAGSGVDCGIIIGTQSWMCGRGSTPDHGGGSFVRGVAKHAPGWSSRNCRQGVKRPGPVSPDQLRLQMASKPDHHCARPCRTPQGGRWFRSADCTGHPCGIKTDTG